MIINSYNIKIINDLKERNLLSLKNNISQIYIKTIGDAWINPINYNTEEILKFTPEFPMIASIHHGIIKGSNLL